MSAENIFASIIPAIYLYHFDGIYSRARQFLLINDRVIIYFCAIEPYFRYTLRYLFEICLPFFLWVNLTLIFCSRTLKLG